MDSLETQTRGSSALISRDAHGTASSREAARPLNRRLREQLSLLDIKADIAKRERSQQLVATLDAMNQKMARGTARLGVARPDAAWQLRCAHRSARYTTNWQELKRLR
ncbi:DUF4113 domain-containing protein [Cobetia sp. 14N.309.X.WAT.E.A4]|uniref:DUF4113 domain-containing protein n=1 Tax=Cobetia sp. 14N.309.X.WAT.E.A4 TaxID=2998323 RepID=UPI00339D66AB